MYLDHIANAQLPGSFDERFLHCAVADDVQRDSRIVISQTMNGLDRESMPLSYGQSSDAQQANSAVSISTYAGSIELLRIDSVWNVAHLTCDRRVFLELVGEPF